MGHYSELPKWVFDLVIAIERRNDEHDQFYVMSRTASDGYEATRDCGCKVLDLVPQEVRHAARAIANYTRDEG